MRLDMITIPSGRFREANPKRVESIAQSMMKFGQLQPIIIAGVGDGWELVDGLHRYCAMQANGEVAIEVMIRGEEDEIFLREIELETNIEREDMTWQQRNRAIAELHRMRVARDPTWGQAQTMALTGVAGQSTVSNALKLDRMMELFPEIKKAENVRQALSWAATKAKSVLRVEEVKASPADYSNIESKIWLGDSVERIREIPDDSFHAVITDPPFGIDYDSRTEGTIGSTSAYEDSEKSYLRLLSMAPDIYRVIKKDGWLIWFLGITWYERAKTAFRQAGFTVDEIPIIWDRSEGRTFTSRPDRYFGRSYDIALHCLKGNPKIVQPAKNIIRIAPVADTETLVERPVELYAELIKRLTIPNEIVADFFVGSGSCAAAASSLRRDYFGIELSPERRAYAIKKIKAHTPDA